MLAVQTKIEGLWRAKPLQPLKREEVWKHNMASRLLSSFTYCLLSVKLFVLAASVNRTDRPPFVLFKSEHAPCSSLFETPVLCRLFEKILSPRSHAQQLAIIVIEGVIVASMNTRFWCVFFLHLDQTDPFLEVVFLKHYFFPPAWELLFCNGRVFSIGQVKRSIAQFSAWDLVSSMIQ